MLCIRFESAPSFPGMVAVTFNLRSNSSFKLLLKAIWIYWNGFDLLAILKNLLDGLIFDLLHTEVDEGILDKVLLVRQLFLLEDLSHDFIL